MSKNLSCVHLAYIAGMNTHVCGISGNACDSCDCPAYESEADKLREAKEGYRQSIEDHTHPDE